MIIDPKTYPNFDAVLPGVVRQYLLSPAGADSLALGNSEGVPLDRLVCVLVEMIREGYLRLEADQDPANGLTKCAISVTLKGGGGAAGNEKGGSK